MPGIPLVARDSSESRSADQMCRQESHLLSAGERNAAEESLSGYCKPVELYNILQRRATINPLFLQRCLHYKIQAKHRRRIQLSVSLSEKMTDGLQSRSLFPLYILLARSVSGTAAVEHSVVYRFRRACILTSCTGVEASSRLQASFILPEINKVSSGVKLGSLAILLVSCEDITSSLGTYLTKDNKDMVSIPSNIGGCCLVGKISVNSLYLSWEKSPNLSLGERVELQSDVSFQSCFVKLSSLDEEKDISIQLTHDADAVSTSQLVPVVISAEEVGAKDRSPYNSYSYNDDPTSMCRIMRLRSGNVIFNYRYYYNMFQRTEVTEDFSCPFCLVKCASFKGLKVHLPSSHELFNFEFWVTEEYQAVNVSVKTDLWKSETGLDRDEPSQSTFFVCSKPLRRRKPKSLVQKAKYVHPHVLNSNMPVAMNELRERTDCVSQSVEYDTYSANAIALSSTAHSSANPDCVQSAPGSNLRSPAMLPSEMTRKLPERSETRNRALLQKRQFFHSHRAQPMEMEQVLSEQDSEGEIDDDIADFEDRRMLDDFVDVTKDEKQMMLLWNSFVRKQSILADNHIPWACEVFSKLHGQDLVRAPSLLGCWKLFMIKLWNHGLLDAKAMNTCNVLLEQCKSRH